MAITPLTGSSEFFKSLRGVNSDKKSSNRAINRLALGGSATDKSITAEKIIDQTFRSKLRVSSILTQNLGNARGAVSVAQAGVKNISELALVIQDKLISLANSNNLESEKRSLTTDLENLLNQAESFIGGSEFNAVNLLSANGKDLNVVATATGEELTITSQSSLGSVINSLSATIKNGSRISDPNSILQSEFKLLEAALAEASTALGVADKAVSLRQRSLQDFNETLIKNLGNVLESDVEREGVRMTAQSVQTQLSRQTLAISNGNPSSVIKLFK